jgi:hypothetical protein
MQELKCLNCYLRVAPGGEDIRMFEFIDSRDTLVSVFNRQTIYVNRYDWNPKLMAIMHDSFGNVITPRSAADL